MREKVGQILFLKKKAIKGHSPLFFIKNVKQFGRKEKKKERKEKEREEKGKKREGVTFEFVPQ